MSTRNAEREPFAHSDAQGYYRALRLAPEASAQEIQLAYEMLTEISDEERGVPLSEVERAYTVLINPGARRIYDRVCRSGASFTPRTSGPTRRSLDDWRVLAATTALLVAILGFVWLPLYGDRFRSFSAGDRLVNLQGAAFGVVVETADRHDFPTGISAEAILIDLADGSGLRWFPAADIRGTCRKAR